MSSFRRDEPGVLRRIFAGVVPWLHSHQNAETPILMGVALLIGLGAGFGALGFSWLIRTFHSIAFEDGRRWLFFLGDFYVVVLPAIGGLFVGLLIYYLAREAKGHGVPEVMEAVAARGGRIRPIVVVVKALASSICIGTGGAAGREGPIVQIGSALGSTFGQVLRMSEDRTRTLVACGAAGGIAATFNAPIAGVIFALEVILGEFTAGNFAVLVISSVTASVVTRVFVGEISAFSIPQYSLQSSWELFLYAALGIIAALVAIAFVRLLYWSEDLSDALRFPEYLKPVLGGLGVGVIGFFFPQVFGVGYETIESVLHNDIVFTTVGLLVIAKIVATSLTLGSGGSGGVFAPSLFIGAMLGGAFGGVAQNVLPGVVAPPGAYAVVGMASVFSAAARSPISAVLILFEMTGDYRIILPLMLSTVIATVVARHFEPESIYTMKLARRGTHLRQGRDVDLMQGVKVADVMDRETHSVAAAATLGDLTRLFESSRRHALPVLAEDGTLLGIVSIHDLEIAHAQGSGQASTIRDIATKDLITVSPDDDMWTALRKMGPRDLSSLPVVDARYPTKLLGVVRRRNIVRAYNIAIIRKQEIQHRVDTLRLGNVTGTKFITLRVAPGSAVSKKSLREIRLPEQSVIVSIRRDSQMLIPRGGTAFQEGDEVTAFVKNENEEAVRVLFR